MQTMREHSADHYRAEAAKLRRNAEQMGHGPIRAEMLSIAQSYERLADMVEIIARGGR
jgi:hypothetical protein